MPPDQDAARRRASIPVWVIDGNADTSRAGPRVVDGASLIHLVLGNIEAHGIVRYH